MHTWHCRRIMIQNDSEHSDQADYKRGIGSGSSPTETKKKKKESKIRSKSAFASNIGMARVAKSAKTTRSRKKRYTKNEFIDDEAEESFSIEIPPVKTEFYRMQSREKEEFEMVEHGSENEAAVELDPDETISGGSSAGASEPGAVIDVTDSSGEEDMMAIARDDRMFPKPNGVKSTAASKRASADGASGSGVVKKAKFVAREPVSRELNSLTGPEDDEMKEFMAAWKRHRATKSVGGVLDDSDHEDDPSTSTTDQNPVGKASRREVGVEKKKKEIGRRLRYSPDWDPPAGIMEDGSVETDPKAIKIHQSRQHASRQTERALDRGNAIGSGRRAAAAEDEREAKSVARTKVLADEPMLSKSQDAADVEPPSTVFLEDLETYKAYFDPSAPCGVADPDLQDPALERGYSDLHPLPAGRRILPAFDPQGMTEAEDDDGIKGGRVKFSSWTRHLRNMLADNSIGALVFKEADPYFINPSRVSPLRLASQTSTGSSPTQRLQVGNRIAVCVSALFCSESVLVEPAKIGPKSERMRKWVSGVFHNQEWERFESVMCLVFGEDLMYSQISPKKAVSFQTMLSPENAGAIKDTDSRFKVEAPSDMFAPIKTKTPKKGTLTKTAIKTKTLLAFNDEVPVYDARKVVVDFQADLGRLDDVLPKFIGEIPFGSFIVVGYTASCYKGARGGSTDKVAQLGCNLVWVVVCGTPVKKR
ncbi:hypothetical protein B0H16DRAFT_1699910 [Mycena metata]|uniref:Uncharacterized protein n=1 Tax=Mycena metata TaxID=1033252 RepID=A0AAD7HHA2_9AGAR|nr:hypothetical protein B0H16DRAFT_1699910 [Mycena metata]